MHELICPQRRRAFAIDDAGYADLVKQVRDEEFAKSLDERLERAERQKRGELALAEAKLTGGFRGRKRRRRARLGTRRQGNR